MRQPPRRERRPRREGGALEIALGGGDTNSVQRAWPQPSNYSLTPTELARHARDLRRHGWQSWEINVRLDLNHLDAA